jgi:hypothetical protein
MPAVGANSVRHADNERQELIEGEHGGIINPADTCAAAVRTGGPEHEALR